MMKNILISAIAAIGISVLIYSCKEDAIGPIIDLTGTNFVAPSINNAATGGPTDLLPENADNTFEEFTWTTAEYGVQIPINYVLEIDSANNFPKPYQLTKTANTSFSINVTKFNDAVLNLGLPAFAETTVYLRVRSVVVGADVDTLVSQTIARTITPYRLSDCGNYCTVGIIGDATQGGWSNDIDMQLADKTGADRSTWKVTLYLTAASAKFRASDGWDVNWGAASFPTGTGIQNGDNIPISAAGYYTVTFNDATGAFDFQLLTTPVFTTVGIIGDGTAGGWDTDTNLTQDGTDPHVWAGSITFTDGSAKFRAEDAWTKNWGSDTYPSGVGVQDGANIPVVAGTYDVWFNDATGEYAIQSNSTKFTTIGLIGTATAGGWDTDTDLIPNPSNPFKYSAIIDLTDGEAKFRAENGWDFNWGASTFPSGVGIQNGPNIPVQAGKYVVFFNSGTGEYRLLK